jgi:hypothetical protein
VAELEAADRAGMLPDAIDIATLLANVVGMCGLSPIKKPLDFRPKQPAADQRKKDVEIGRKALKLTWPT